MQRATRFKPDTCECVFDIGWDDAAIDRVHTWTLVTPCTEHADVVDPFTEIVAGENHRKNRITAALAERIGAKADDISFRFTPARGLVLGVPANHRAAAGLARAALRGAHGEFEIE